MALVPAGSRLVLRSAGGNRALRTLRDVVLLEGWCIPVVGDVGVLDAVDATVDLPTDEGAMTLQVRLEGNGSGLFLRPVGFWGTLPVQRRGDIRSAVTLPVRGAVLPRGPLAGPPPPMSGEAPRIADLEGATLNASGGGLAVGLRGPARLDAGARLYVELDLPDGAPAPAVAIVVAQRGTVLRARFRDIALRDRERLVRVVFERHRAELAQLAQRRRSLKDPASGW